jgi:hypothetical protein
MTWIILSTSLRFYPQFLRGTTEEGGQAGPETFIPLHQAQGEAVPRSSFSQKKPMILFMGEVFPQETRDPIEGLVDLFIGKTFPDRLHQPVIGKLLEVDDEGGLIDLPGEADGHRTPVGFNELV